MNILEAWSRALREEMTVTAGNWNALFIINISGMKWSLLWIESVFTIDAGVIRWGAHWWGDTHIYPGDNDDKIIEIVREKPRTLRGMFV